MRGIWMLPVPYGEYIDRSVFARIDWNLH